MKAASPGLLVLLVLGATANDQKVNPVQKVVELLKKLQAQVEEEGKTEAAQYDKFACFCKEQAREKTWAIEKSEKKIKKLEAEIEELEAEIAELTEKVAELTETIEKLEKKIEKLVEERKKELKAYLVEAKDMDDAISAMKRAIEALKKSKAEMSDAKLDFVQLRAVLQTGLQITNLSEAQTQAVAALLDEKQAPHGSAYHSNDIIETLKEMQMQFKENKAELDKTEIDAKALYDKKKQGAENEKQFAKQDKQEAEELIGKKEDELSTAKEDLAAETKDKEADEAFVKELTTTCEDKAKLWDQRSTSRGKELAAISEAIEVIAAGSGSNYGANAKLVDLQVAEGKDRVLSFLQRGSESAAQRLSVSRAHRYLEDVAQRLNSSVLSMLALKAEAQKDHFVKVRSMIKDFITKLEKDAEEEAEQKSFCDKEMGKAVDSRDEENAKIEKLTAEISKMTMQIKKLKAEIAELSMQIGELYKALKEATDMRAEEKAANEKTLTDATAGLQATKYALKVLKGFYEPKLLQYTPPNAGRDGKTVGDLAPDTFADEEYKGNQDAAKGIIGLIEVIISDFERTIKTTEKAEEDAQEEFDKFKADTEADIKDKEKSKKEKEGKVADLTDKLAEAKEKLKGSKKELGLVMEELGKLQEQCVEQPVDWKEKNKKRQEEIEALKKAIVILDEWQQL